MKTNTRTEFAGIQKRLLTKKELAYLKKPGKFNFEKVKKKRNKQDATLINNDARKKEIEDLRERVALIQDTIEGFEEWITGIEERVAKLEPIARHKKGNGKWKES